MAMLDAAALWSFPPKSQGLNPLSRAVMWTHTPRAVRSTHHPSVCTKQLQDLGLSSISLMLSIFSTVLACPKGALRVDKPSSGLRPCNAKVR